MTDIAPADPIAAPRRGRLAEALVRLFMRRAEVASSERLGPAFRLITLDGPQLRDVAWTVGQKVQIAMGAGFATRTYTPIDWDAASGRTRLLAYAHGDGPGSDWVLRARPGDRCEVFGPRASLDLGERIRPAVVFGDETSLALAVAIARQSASASVRYLFEAHDADAVRPVLAEFGLADAVVFGRRPNDEHLREVAQEMAASADARFILTGKATSIQFLRRTLKGMDVPSSRVMTKAYWAPGKTGLD